MGAGADCPSLDVSQRRDEVIASFTSCLLVLRKFWRQRILKLRALFGPDTGGKKRLPYLKAPREAKSSAACPGYNKNASKPAP